MCEVVEKKLLVVLVGGDRLIVRGAHAADEVQHRRRRDRVLHGGVARDFLQAVEGLEERMVGGEGEAVFDDDRLGLGLTTFEVNGPGLGLDVADALEAGKEVEVPEGAAEFAVGDGGEAVVELLLHERGDLLVLDGGEGFAGELAPGERGAGLCDGGGTKEASDDVGTVRGKNVGHGAVPFLMCCWKASGASRRPETTAVHTIYYPELSCGKVIPQ